jgi:glycosyltransferase involved in cell wall biosynthesis
VSVIGIDASRAVSNKPTGTEAYSYHLTRTLVPLLQDRHAVRLYFRAPPLGGVSLDPGVAWWGKAEVCTIPFPRLWTHARLSWEMLRRPPDLLFVPAHVLPLAHPQHTLVTVHDLGYRTFPEAHPAGQRSYLDLSTRWSVHTATHILADSEATRTAAIEIYNTKPEKITVVYPGYEADLQPVRDVYRLEQVRQRYAIPGAYILFLGRIQPRKNLVRLVEAFAALAPQYPDLTLVLAGPTGWLSDPIVARIEALGLNQRVRLPGYVAAEDKAALISGAHVFAYPSLYEGFGFPVLEAQACGTPLLTSTTSSLPEVAGAGALLVDPEDVDAIATGLVRLLEDTGHRENLVQRGFRNLTRFSWAKAAEQTATVIASLLAA